MINQLFKFAGRGNHPKNLLVVTDLGRDPDDEVLFLQLAGLARLGMANIKGVVVNQSPIIERAALAKATLDAFADASVVKGQNRFASIIRAQINALGLDNVPVAVGTYGDAGHVLRDYEFNASYLSSDHQKGLKRSGQTLIKDQLVDLHRKDEKATLLLVSAMQDADQFLFTNKALAQASIEEVVIMGGVETDEQGHIKTDEDGCLIPDLASNNRFGNHENKDKNDHVSDGARRLYKNLQLYNIPTTIVTREAAYGVQVGYDYYQDLAATGHPVAERLAQMQKEMILAVLEDVLTLENHPRLNPDWFANTFLKDPSQDLHTLLSKPDEVIDHVKGFNLYDPLTAIYSFFPRLFEPTKLDGYPMQVIGTSADDIGIKDRAAVSELLRYLPRAGFGLEPNIGYNFTGLKQSIAPRISPEYKRFI